MNIISRNRYDRIDIPTCEQKIGKLANFMSLVTLRIV